MNLAAILALVANGYKVAKAYWPVVAAGIVLASKLISGDQSGVSEAIAMLLSAWGSIHSGNKSTAAVKSIEGRAMARASASARILAAGTIPPPVLVGLESLRTSTQTVDQVHPFED